jgi:cob(I)alamin adenosyltransferase
MAIKIPKKLHQADHGLIHAYLGDGKGKTTAAVGTVVRAAGHGWKIAFIQFMKEAKWPSGERTSLRKLGIEVFVMGEGFYKILDDQKSEDQHKLAAAKALELGSQKLLSGEYQLVVMDELGSAMEEGLLDKKAVEKMFKDRAKDKIAKQVNLIWTGHQKIGWMLKYADLITDMKKVKHPFDKGIIAARGLDY